MSGRAIAKTKHGMSVAEGALWWLLLIPMSAGLLYPFYRARKHSLDRTYTTYGATR